jgi:hypothetical protein
MHEPTKEKPLAERGLAALLDAIARGDRDGTITAGIAMAKQVARSEGDSELAMHLNALILTIRDRRRLHERAMQDRPRFRVLAAWTERAR